MVEKTQIDFKKLCGKIVRFRLKDGFSIEGIVIERPKLLGDDVIVLKLNNGYNIGIKVDNIESIEILSEVRRKEFSHKEYRPREKLPWVSIIGTGGTIASKVDYTTGGVIAQYKPEELVDKFPFILDLVNIKTKVPMCIFSEEFCAKYYKILAEEIWMELQDKKLEGIIVMHGTDTMHFSSAIISFMIQNLPIPIIFTGAQRSSDRPSSDAYFNLLASCLVAIKSNVAEVGICMHGDISDTICYFHRGTRVRKMHSSRRDTFKSINCDPILEINLMNREVKIIEKPLRYKNRNREPVFFEKLEEKVALVYHYPGFDPEVLDFYLDRGYKGIVIAGTGLGHVSIKSKPWTSALERAKEEGVIVCMTTQTLYGTTHPYVYSTARELALKYNVLYLKDMLPEVAYVKLMWALGNFSDLNEVKQKMLENIAGEISDRRIK